MYGTLRFAKIGTRCGIVIRYIALLFAYIESSYREPVHGQTQRAWAQQVGQQQGDGMVHVKGA
jgi:hypothetical protein